MGSHSDDESQSRKKLKSSETNANYGKQKSCIQFSKGRCRYGGKCRYVHDIGRRMKPCKFFDGGRRACRYGDKCRYIHNSGDGLQSSTNTNTRLRIVPNPYDYDAKLENLSHERRPTTAIRIKPDDFGKSEEKLVSNPTSAIPILPNPNDDRGKSKILPSDPHNAVPVKTRAHGNAEVRRVDLDSSTGYAASKNAEPESQRGKFPANKLGNLKTNSQVYGYWIQDLH